MHPVESYLRDLAEIRATGAAVPETSYYPALSNLLNEIGSTLVPRVRCVINIQNRGAGLPDGGLFTRDQFEHATDEVPPGQTPSRGVIEVKPVVADAWRTASGEQVTRYWGHYGLVLVTNYRDFVLVGRDAHGRTARLESYRVAEGEREFWRLTRSPAEFVKRQGDRFVDFIRRVLLHEAPLTTPRDVAWFLASYAREARARIEGHSDLPALARVRSAFEEALGITFSPTEGRHFFESSFVQTLFYGIFSSWVLWSNEQPPPDDTVYSWRDAAWNLHVPMIAALYGQLATPATLRPLDLEEVLDWTAGVLNRVDRQAFFAAFQAENAVQYFYEPFLEAFDPELRKQLGVWYTPHEVVKYQVARVDWSLRNDLGIENGLADDSVFVLDPCCGTGAYLVEVLNRIAETLSSAGSDALTTHDLKRAALSRIFGFELLPAPFVIAHLQLGVLLQRRGSPLDVESGERFPVFLTNALTGWEPPEHERQPLLIPGLEEERELADEIKRNRRILVILGNPPYDNYAKIARIEEERSLSLAYSHSLTTRQPEGQGRNDLYVRFFRMAERRIVDMTGCGIVSFISNYSWLEGLSHPAMRERYLDVFDSIRIDSLNGDRNRTGKVTPTGEPDPSVFSTEYNRAGIKVGTAITLLVRKQDHSPAPAVLFRDFWGRSKRAQLVDAANTTSDSSYEHRLVPRAELGYPFAPVVMDARYLDWPLLPALFPVSFPGVKTSRDDALIDIDRDRLASRMQVYLGDDDDAEAARVVPSLMKGTTGFKARDVRRRAQSRGFRDESIIRCFYRPFDTRWLYWDGESGMLDRSRPDYKAHVVAQNLWIEARQKQVEDDFDRGIAVRDLADNMGNGLSSYFPMLLVRAGTVFESSEALASEPNISAQAASYLDVVGEVSERELFHHALAILQTPAYRRENRGALRLDWPRIPLPQLRARLRESAELGERVGRLFDTTQHVPGVTEGKLPQTISQLGSIARVGGGVLDPARGDLNVTAGWGRIQEGVVFPGLNAARTRAYSSAEMQALESGADESQMSAVRVVELLGEETVDVPLNPNAYWKNVPLRVWDYTASGYAVLKKWLSYREMIVLGRPITAEEAREFTRIVRRIAALLLLSDELDASYEACIVDVYPWAVANTRAGTRGDQQVLPL
ncbi:MAG TPA: type ISP restriction/modification enzyme [Gemmatimonadaceae bacterium]|nr:type ISP restriction/modification enzyme [Gemmatimonadaceae bacterium]